MPTRACHAKIYANDHVGLPVAIRAVPIHAVHSIKAVHGGEMAT